MKDDYKYITAKNKYDVWMSKDRLSEDLKKDLISITNSREEITDRFFSSLSFGTSGLRGIIGAGTNRINLPIIKQITEGVGRYLIEQSSSNTTAIKVLIAYDSRHMSKEFAEISAIVLSSMGIKTFVFSELTPVSVLSYAIRECNATLGIMITASHNPKEYNGYKVYNSKGIQLLPNEAKDIQKKINEVPLFSDLVLDKNFSYLDDKIKKEFISKMVTEKRYINTVSLTEKQNTTIVYTPLNGTGYEYVVEALNQLGFSNTLVVGTQKLPDSNFTTCPTPNPELLEVYREGATILKENAGDIIIATDPDSDRVGAALKDSTGKVKLLSGNEIACLLLQFLIDTKQTCKNQYVFKSIVTTPLVEYIAKKNQLKVQNTLTGFKYIGDLVTKLEENNQIDKFLMGAEESNGFLFVPYVRDKDGLTTTIMIAHMVAYYKGKGLKLLDVLDKIYDEHGALYTTTLSHKFNLLGYVEKAKEFMHNLQEEIYKAFDEDSITQIIDYNKAKGHLPATNMIQVDFNNNERIIFRPSGTEPKIKIYFYGKENSRNYMQLVSYLKTINK